MLLNTGNSFPPLEIPNQKLAGFDEEDLGDGE